MSDQNKKLWAIRDLLQSAQNALLSARKILATLSPEYSTPDIGTEWLTSYTSEENKIIEWVFTGDSMLGSDGYIYPVPANYASKSLIVQGSKLKATIDPNGKIIYKIIEEIPYEVKKWFITKNGERYQITTDDRSYNVLLAAVTFHKANIWDQVSIRVPDGKTATFAVIDAVIPRKEE